jgi:hypothetical protein
MPVGFRDNCHGSGPGSDGWQGKVPEPDLNSSWFTWDTYLARERVCLVPVAAELLRDGAVSFVSKVMCDVFVRPVRGKNYWGCVRVCLPFVGGGWDGVLRTKLRVTNGLGRAVMVFVGLGSFFLLTSPSLRPRCHLVRSVRLLRSRDESSV